MDALQTIKDSFSILAKIKKRVGQFFQNYFKLLLLGLSIELLTTKNSIDDL